MTNQKEELRKILEEEFEAVEFPVSGKMALASELPSGPGTKFETEDMSVTAMELASIAGFKLDFPYEDVESLLDDSIGALEDEGFFEEDDYME